MSNIYIKMQTSFNGSCSIQDKNSPQVSNKEGLKFRLKECVKVLNDSVNTHTHTKIKIDKNTLWRS